MNDMDLNLRERNLLTQALQGVIGQIAHVRDTVSSRLGSRIPNPPELDVLIQGADSLVRALQANPSEVIVSMNASVVSVGLLRSALAFHRRQVADRVQRAQQYLTTAEQIEAAGVEVAELDKLLSKSPFSSAEPMSIPRIADYLTPAGREAVQPSTPLADVETDPKHRILLSSSLIEHDIEVYRQQCADRQLPFALLYCDVDGFKVFNSAKGEVYVDRFVLPPLLAAVEAAAYGHGRAYRHGGDEFLLLLPNSYESTALEVAKRLAKRVSELSFAELNTSPRLSIGIWLTHPESPLTASELVAGAAAAKQRAKDLGRNRIVLHIETSGSPTESRYETEV